MLAQGNDLGFAFHPSSCALKGRGNPLPFQGGRQYLGAIPGALHRACILRAVGAKKILPFQDLPFFGRYRSDPRYHALLQKMNLA